MSDLDTTPSVEFTAATIPDAPAKPVVTEDGSYLLITWTVPANVNHADVTDYEVRIKDNADAYGEFTSVCDGTNRLVDGSNFYCRFLHSALWPASPTGPELGFNDKLIAKVAATNSRGQSAFSDSSDSDQDYHNVEAVPDGMIAPTESAATSTSITIAYTALTSPNDGRSALTSYEIQWDQGLGDSEANYETIAGGASLPTHTLATFTKDSGITAG